MATAKFPPYLRVTGQRRDERGVHVEIRLLRWHPAWWGRCWQVTTDELGLSPWNPFTWLLTLEFITGGAGGETDV
jgi:hypothetical protein